MSRRSPVGAVLAFSLTAILSLADILSALGALIGLFAEILGSVISCRGLFLERSKGIRSGSSLHLGFNLGSTL